MEEKLKKWFDLQQFEQNPRLMAMLEETEARYGQQLTDDDLSQVAAAGEPAGTPPPGFGL